MMRRIENKPSRFAKPALALLLALTTLATLRPAEALAQTDDPPDDPKSANRVEVGFSDGIAGEVLFDDLLDVLVAHTLFSGQTEDQARFLIVTGVGMGGERELSEANVSVPVNLVPGKKTFILLGEGPLDSPWDAFEEPVLGFEEPVLGFDNPIISFEEPVLGFEEPVLGFEDALSGLNKVWGTGGTAIEEGFYGLVLFTMPDPSFDHKGVEVLHRAVVVPFKVGAAGLLGRVQDVRQDAFGPGALHALTERTFEVAAYPNPFNPQTTIRYALPQASQVRLTVYDLLGREVARLVERVQTAGTHEAVFEAGGLPGGVYLYRIEAGVYTAMHSMTLMK